MKTIYTSIQSVYKRTHLLAGIFAFWALLFTLAAPKAYAELSVNGGFHTVDLIAGQNIDAGDVSVEVAGDSLLVTFETMDGWELTEAHLWVGQELASMPQTKRGNPKIGNFPFASGDISGDTLYVFLIPLSGFGGTDYATSLCDQTFLIAAHAAVRKADGSGAFQSETGWGSGDSIVDRGSWAMYFNFNFTCDEQPPISESCETAFAYGDRKLWDIEDVSTGDPITNRWGWQITVNPGDYSSQPIYAGAGQNDINKGTHVGNLVYAYNGSSVTVNFEMFSGFLMEETHLYVGSSDAQTAAPGQFGNLHDLSGSSEDSYTITVSGDTINIVAHAVVCGNYFE